MREPLTFSTFESTCCLLSGKFIDIYNQSYIVKCHIIVLSFRWHWTFYVNITISHFQYMKLLLRVINAQWNSNRSLQMRLQTKNVCCSLKSVLLLAPNLSQLPAMFSHNPFISAVHFICTEWSTNFVFSLFAL